MIAIVLNHALNNAMYKLLNRSQSTPRTCTVLETGLKPVLFLTVFFLFSPQNQAKMAKGGKRVKRQPKAYEVGE